MLGIPTIANLVINNHSLSNPTNSPHHPTDVDALMVAMECSQNHKEIKSFRQVGLVSVA